MLIYLGMIESEEDKSKFERIYRKYRRFMFQIAMNILHSEADAEDAVHQSFLYLAEHMKNISDPDCPKTRAYIAIICEHSSIDQYRARQRVSGTPFDEALNAASADIPEDGTLKSAILRLQPRYREVVLLRYYHGYSVHEIADMFNLRYDAAQKLLRRAKESLKKMLEEEEETE